MEPRGGDKHDFEKVMRSFYNAIEKSEGTKASGYVTSPRPCPDSHTGV